MSHDFEPPDETLTDRVFSTLATEQINPATTEIDRQSPLEVARAINAEDATVAGAVERELPQIASAIEAIAARLRSGGRLIYIGAGTSGRLGALDAVECPPTFNVSPELVVACIAGGSFALTEASERAEDDAAAGEDDARRLAVSARDALVGITASGRTPYVLGAVAYARTQGALTIGLVCNADTPLARRVDISIAPLVGPEVISGSTRLKAGIAQKMALNMLSTGTMILLGKTFGNLMVDVQATNAKLRRRALEIVRQATGLGADAAAELLRATDGEVKTAILVARTGVTPALARERLAAHGAVLRVALEAGS
ncbi:MAG TPA: N-acetylmuramic acid 6-phosphate etherase [Ktedonobacterales bacterium]|nr:N-acetylmuramic acid 6-phosphate etherase [Ktedonobacterales bacterium]